MNMYLLKSTYERQYCGDVIIDLDSIESITSGFTKKDKKENCFMLLISMKSEAVWSGYFHTETEMKEVIEEIMLLGNNKSNTKQIVHDLKPELERSEEEKKKYRLNLTEM